MKIQVTGGGKNIQLNLPTSLLFSEFVIGMVLRGHNHLPDIPPEAAKILTAELKRIRKERGGWDLVEVETVSGERVIITI